MNSLKKHTCSYCERKFARKDSMQRHIREIHGQTPQMSNHRFKCPDIKCSSISHSMQALRQHIVREHGVYLDVEENNFLTFEGIYSFIIFFAYLCYFLTFSFF